MDVCALLDNELRRVVDDSIPDRWRTSGELDEVGTLGSLICSVRRLDDQSDSLLLALLGGQARGDPLCVAVIVTALAPLVLARCRGRRERVDDYVSELAVVIGMVEIEALRRSRRRVGGVLLDRAWDAVRSPVRRPSAAVPVDPSVLCSLEASWSCSVEDEALARVEFAEYESSVRHAAVVRPWVWPAWASAVELAGRTGRDPVEARRWKYVRTVLRRHVPRPDVAA